MGYVIFLNVLNFSESGGSVNGILVVFKMGVRVRVFEWFFKKDCFKDLVCKVLWESRF